jgi:formate hydrogenlyase transcriptional activator
MYDKMKKNDHYATALEEHLKFESLLGAISANLVNLPLDEIDSAIESSIKKIVEFFNVDRCHLGMFSGDHSKIIVSHFYSRPGIKIPQITDVGDHFLSFIYNHINKGKTLTIEKVTEFPAQAKEEQEFFKKSGIKSMVVLPLYIDKSVEFGLSLSTVNEHRQWPEHTITHIQIVGNILANVLQRRIILHQIAKEKELSEAIMQGMPQLAYIYDIEGRLKRWNTNVVKVLGYTSEELQDKFVGDFIAEADRENVIAAVQAVFTDGQERQIEYDMLTKSGKKIPFYGSGVKAMIDGEPFLIGLTIDITELKEAQRRIYTQLQEIKSFKDQLEAENLYLRKELIGSHSFDEIIGESNILKHILYRVEQVAPMDTTVLLEGETGTGKELFARAIHQRSKRCSKPMITVNCASLPANLVESELFGHEKGAFTGALQKQIGRFELADGGTIFLDEVGEIPLELQSKLLRVLQEGTFERIGSAKTITVDVRVIAATNRDLQEEIDHGRFRNDLYYRLNVYPITIVPLRERTSDIALLVDHFVKRFNQKMGKHINKIPKKVMKELSTYTWPGNIRELKNVVERAVILSQKSTLSIELQPAKQSAKEDKLVSLQDHERAYIEKVLQKTFWRIDGPQGAARILEMHPETLRSRMRKLGITRSSINI